MLRSALGKVPSSYLLRSEKLLPVATRCYFPALKQCCFPRSSSSYFSIASVEIRQQELQLQWTDGKSSAYDFTWLRDNCLCDACYEPNTKQRQIDTSTIAEGIRPLKAFLQDRQLRIVWDKETHESQYPFTFFDDVEKSKGVQRGLSEFGVSSQQLRSLSRVLPEVDFNELTKKESFEGRKKALTLLHQYGFLLVRNTPANTEGTKQVGSSVSGGVIRNTLFGELWDITQAKQESQAFSHADTAYGNAALFPHTDGCYFTNSPGLQLFHILEHTGKGGENTVVDGFLVGDYLRQEEQDVFEYLSTKPMEFHYFEEGVQLHASIPVFTLDFHGNFVQFRYNNDDRSPKYIHPHEAPLYYKAVKTLLRQLKNIDKFGHSFLLDANSVLVTNNWRVLHGRKEFSGTRRLAGCYIDIEDYKSQLRVHQVH